MSEPKCKMLNIEKHNPDSLYHYTSVGVLLKLFSNIQDGNFLFHASSVDSMNDGAEYRESNNLCTDKANEIIVEHDLGKPFALCFSTCSDNIPMWNMYANRGKGVCLRFSFVKLEQYFNVLKEEYGINAIFSKCKYKKISSIDDKPLIGKKTNYPSKRLCEKMMKAAFSKPTCFKHEGEWRLMIWQNYYHMDKLKIMFKEKQNTLCPYIEIPVPVNCLAEIILGPSASEQMIDATRLLQFIYCNRNITVDVSRITLKI